MKWLNFYVCVLIILAGGCRRVVPASAPLKTYAAHGVVEKIAADGRNATIAHEAIPGYMMAMTMNFTVQNTNEMNGVSPGDVVTFNLQVRDDDEWIENVRRTGRTTVSPVPPAAPAAEELKAGDPLPDFEFITETGERRHLTDFRGQAVAFTFFFTSCPLPDYCPRMNKDFGTARQLVVTTANAPTNWQFLSISFDPTFDTPEILSSYAGLYRGENTNRWLFAVIGTNTLAAIAPRLDLIVMRNGPGISHNLRTVVLDPTGRIHRQFDGNQWTPQQLADAIIEAAQSK